MRRKTLIQLIIFAIVSTVAVFLTSLITSDYLYLSVVQNGMLASAVFLFWFTTIGLFANLLHIFINHIE